MATTAPRFGIEEEFFLLDPQRGTPRPVAAQLLGCLPPASSMRASREFLASQLEHATTVCETADDAAEQLRRFRADLAHAAAAIGVVAGPTGTPFDVDGPPVLSPGDRYREIGIRHAALLDDHQVAALHVHIEIPDRETGVLALRALSGWLPLLKTLTGNSPWWAGRDTGFASWRTVLLRRWTTGGCPPAVADAAEYAFRAASLVGIGGTRDEATVAWDVRMSTRYPTVELRTADSQLTADDSLLIAQLARGIVAGAIRRGEADPPDPELVDAACWHAARFGLSEDVLPPGGTALVAPQQAAILLTDLLQLDDDAELIAAGLARIMSEGIGAERQRAAALTGGWSAVAELYRLSLLSGDGAEGSHSSTGPTPSGGHASGSWPQFISE